MSVRLESEVKFTDVVKAIKKVAMLETDIDITEETALSTPDLGLEGSDFLDLFHEMGIPYMRYTSGEAITEEGRKVLGEIAKQQGSLHFRTLASARSVYDLTGNLVAGDLVVLAKYAGEHK